MFEDGDYTEDEITADELTDLAFGMFTIFSVRRLAAVGKQFYAEIESADAKAVFESFKEDFSQQYPDLAEPIAMFGDTEDILSFYRYGEGVIPTRTTHMYWIAADAPGVSPDACSTDAAGKWLLFLPPADIDDAWIKIRDATADGKLGIGAKVSTAHENKDARDTRKVIYVFTKSWEDEADVMRVREYLRTLGFTDRIGYKRNIDTYAGEYREKGKRVTYYSI